MVAIFGIDYNSSEFDTYLITKSHKHVINTRRKHKGVNVEAGLMKNYIVSGSGIDRLIDDFIGRPTILSIPFCPYHFVRTNLSATFLF